MPKPLSLCLSPSVRVKRGRNGGGVGGGLVEVKRWVPGERERQRGRGGGGR